jgi:hypothetical protein
MAMRIFGVSSHMFYGDQRRVPRPSAGVRESKVAVSIGSWFELLKKTADIMPDEGWYQLNAPKKSVVYQVNY